MKKISDDRALINACRRRQLAFIMSGKQHPALQEMARRHARYQAAHKLQGHQLWDSRVKELYQDLPNCGTFSEDANESWAGDSRSAAVTGFFKSWRQSPGHWNELISRCDYWGISMHQGTNKIWYADIIFAQKR